MLNFATKDVINEENCQVGRQPEIRLARGENEGNEKMSEKKGKRA